MPPLGGREVDEETHLPNGQHGAGAMSPVATAAAMWSSYFHSLETLQPIALGFELLVCTVDYFLVQDVVGLQAGMLLRCVSTFLLSLSMVLLSVNTVM